MCRQTAGYGGVNITSRKLAAGILIMIGGALAAAAAFLPWMEESFIETLTGSVTFSQTYTGLDFLGDDFSDFDAYQKFLPAVQAAVGVIVVLLGLATAAAGRASRSCAVAAAVLGLVGLLLVGMFSTWDVYGETTVLIVREMVDYGWATYLALGGHALTLIAGAAGAYIGRTERP